VNRPDIIIKNKADKIYLLIDVAIPSDGNKIQKEAEQKLKCKNVSKKFRNVEYKMLHHTSKH
jgi:hypothetical protein